ncbi:hypothetical protein PR048_029396 [Dryococelus australis]|uniref:Iron-binding zinc finger CDGSH type domain-containing protein n=1 Tax=Dryococelus australis TaxID=614101 RepID=A0ABQ9GD89_9NEOP|nr:hypothetical protein PR048_029396 [Dryococelus australis]
MHFSEECSDPGLWCTSEFRPINPMIRKDCKKVVDFIEVEDIGEKVSLCRCWLSKKWPYCDGAHGPHNRRNGDNTGPVVVRRKPAAEK